MTFCVCRDGTPPLILLATRCSAGGLLWRPQLEENGTDQPNHVLDVELGQKKEMFDENRVAARTRGADAPPPFLSTQTLAHPRSFLAFFFNQLCLLPATRLLWWLLPDLGQSPHPLHNVRDGVIKQYSRSKMIHGCPSYQVTLTCCRVAG